MEKERNRGVNYQQSEPFGCGLYSVANVLNLNNFVTEERKELSKKGNNIPQLTKWLIEDGFEVGLDLFFYNHFGKELPQECLDLKVDEQFTALMPVLFQVQYSEKSLPHLIGGLLNNRGDVEIFDSYKPQTYKIKLKEIHKGFYSVSGMFAFIDLDTNDWLFLNN